MLYGLCVVARRQTAQGVFPCGVNQLAGWFYTTARKIEKNKIK